MNKAQLIAQADEKILLAVVNLNLQIRQAMSVALTSLRESQDLCVQAGMTKRAEEIGSLMVLVGRDYRPQLSEHLPEDSGSSWRERVVDQWLAYAVDNLEGSP